MAIDELTPERLAELTRLSVHLSGILAFLRTEFYNDGAEGESVHRVCAIAEHVPALLDALASHKAAARHNAEVAELWRRAAETTAGPAPTLPDNPTADDFDRFTWQTLDPPTVQYVVELVHQHVGPDAWMALRTTLDRLAQYDGVLPEWRQKRLRGVPR